MKVPTKLEAPDGGWGIFVCIGMAIPFISGLAILPSFGLVFGDFLKSVGAETSEIAFVTSAFFCSLSFAGLFSGSLFRRYGLRNIGLVGALVYFGGSVMQIFVRSTTELLVAFSLLQGAGFGFIIPTAYTSFNNYFVKKRVMWMSLAQSLIGVGTMVYPIVILKLMEWYGFRGCLAILAAINSHSILGMLLMQPVEWHLVKVPITDQELAEVPQVETVNQATITVAATNGNVTASNSPISNDVTATARVPKPTATTVEHITEDPNHLSPLMFNHFGSQKFSREELIMLTSRSSSITSLGNWTGPIVVSDASPEMMHLPTSGRHSIISSIREAVATPRSKWQMIVDFLDLTLLKKFIFVNIVLGISFALYSDIAFFTLQPLYLFHLGFSKPDTAAIIAIGAGADLASRIFLAASAIFIQMPSRYIYMAGAFLSIVARFVFLEITDYVGMACITAVMGFLRTWLHVPLPLVFAEYLPRERFATGYSLFMFLQGNIMFLVGPIVGYIRDLTNDYILTFHCLTVFMVLCAVPWLIEIVCVKFRRKNKIGEIVIENVDDAVH